jgi:MFS family permease
MAYRLRYKWELMLILAMAYFLNQGDRQIYNAVLPLIKADLQVSDVQLGLVTTTFTLLFGVLVLLAGFVGDFVSKKWLVCLSLLIFSMGTLFTGFSSGLLMLIVFRSIATGAGEAFYYPPAIALIGQYHLDTRSQAMAINQTALYVGTVMCSYAAAVVGERYGWRAPFLVFGIAGILLAAMAALRLRNDQRDAGLMQPASQPLKLGEVLRPILRTPTFYFLSLALGGTQFVFFGWMTWTPTYLYEKFHLPLRDAALYAVLYHYGFAFLGVMLGARISDRLASRRRTIRLEVEILGLLCAAPFIWLLGASSKLTVVYVALGGFGFFRGFFDANNAAALFDVIPQRYRSSAAGLMVSCGYMMSAISPMLMGYIKQHASLGSGLSLLAFGYLFSAAMIFVALKWFFMKDYFQESASSPVQR